MHVDAGGIKLWVDRAGSGQAVVFAHGLTQDHTLFAGQREPFAARYQFIAYDIRGYGKSGRVYEPEYTLDTVVADQRALFDALAIDRAVLVGFSYGGLIAQRFAVLHPERVRALVICDAVAQFTPESRAMFEQRAITAETKGMASMPEGMLSRWFTPEFHAKNPERIAALRQQILDNDPRAVAATCRIAATLDLREQITAIRAPTLVLVGEFDRGNPLPKAQEIQERIPGAELAVIPNAAHTGPVEQPAVFNQIVFDFLKRAGI